MVDIAAPVSNDWLLNNIEDPVEKQAGIDKRNEDMAALQEKQDYQRRVDMPSTGEQWDAAWETDNTVSSINARVNTEQFPSVEGHDSLTDENLKGYEQYAKAFIDSTSPEQDAAIKTNLDRETRNRKILAEGDWRGVLSSVAAGAADPINLALMIGTWGVGTGAAAGRMTLSAGRSAAAGVAATGLSEGVLHATQETRTKEETILNMAGTVILDGLLGASIGRMSSNTVDGLRNQIDEVVSGRGSVGAADAIASSGAELKPESPFFRYTGLGWLARQATKVTPLGRTLQSEDQIVRSTVQDLAETHIRVEGDQLAPAVETLVNLDRAKAAGTIIEVRGIQKSSGLSADDWDEALDLAMRSGDKHPNPHVEQAANKLRAEIYDPMLKQAFDARIPGSFIEETGPEGTVTFRPRETTTAASYLTRRYDLNKVREDPEGFRRAWRAGIEDQRTRANVEAQKTLDDFRLETSVERRTAQAEIDAAVALKAVRKGKKRKPGEVAAQRKAAKSVSQAKKVIKKLDQQEAQLAKNFKEELDPQEWAETLQNIEQNILNLRSGDIHAEASGGAMFKGRIDVADEFLRNYLIKDWEQLAHDYTNTVSSRSRLAGKFGDWQMSNRISRIEDEVIARAEGKPPRQKKKIEAKGRKEIRDIEIMRDRILGLYNQGTLNQTHPWLSSGLRTLRNYNSVRMLNSVLLASVPDLSRYMTYSGMAPYSAAIAKAVKNVGLENLPKDDLARLASSINRANSTRLQQLMEMDPNPTSRVEAASEKLAKTGMKLSGLQHFDTFNRTVGGYLVSDKIATDVLAGVNRGKIRALGFNNDMIDSMKTQLNKHAVKEDGLYNPRLDQWDNAQLVEIYEAAVIKETGRLTPTPGVGDRPIIMDHEMGKVMFQFKSFIIGAANRITLPLMQEEGIRPWIEILTATSFGALGYTATNIAAGREPDYSATTLLKEGVDRAGYMNYGMEFYNMASKLTGVGPGTTTRYRSRDVFGAIGGPSAQTISDMMKVIHAGSSADTRVHSARNLMPFQNHFMIRQPLSIAEGEVAKILGGSGKYAKPKQRETAAPVVPAF